MNSELAMSQPGGVTEDFCRLVNLGDQVFGLIVTNLV